MWNIIRNSTKKASIILQVSMVKGRFPQIILLWCIGIETYTKTKNTEPKRTVNFSYSETDHWANKMFGHLPH